MDDFVVLAIGAAVGCAVLAAIFVFAAAVQRRQPSVAMTPSRPETVFLLRNGRVVDHTADAANLVEHTRIGGMRWVDLRAVLRAGFPDLPMEPPTTTNEWHAVFDADMTLRTEVQGGSLRLTLSQPVAGVAAFYRASVLIDEHERLAEVAQNAPEPQWQTDSAERPVWFNDAYEVLCHRAGINAYDAPLMQLPTMEDGEEHSTRVSLPTEDGTPHWYEVVSRPQGNTYLHYASSINSLVNAEMAQRNFVQTLTKTFAHLPIGLAVFDKDRRLVLFNPALVDLTNLPVDFLSAKPNLHSFFDHMRENRMMPEPKDYTNWRDRLYEVVSAARADRYCETWNLPSGLTYKITGRPHPDGAVAFLLEDISAEISLTRRFRSELELTQSVLDCFEDSVAVFSRLGVLTFSNAAYRRQWKCDPDSAFAEITIIDATRDWQRACAPTPIWPDLRDFVLTLRDRAPWDADLDTLDGQRMLCRIEPVSAGATMVRFSEPVPVAETVELAEPTCT